MNASDAPVSAVLLDIDGTLLDSNDAHARSWTEVLQRHHHHVLEHRIRPLIGMGSDKLLPAAAGVQADSEAGRRMADERRERFLQAHLPALRPTPGDRALVQRLRERGVKLVVATSAGAEELQALLRQAQVDDLIDEATTSSDAAESKPAPDIVQAALRRAGVPPGEAVMIGDTPYDVSSARAAGVRVIALRSGGWEDATLTHAEAVYDHPQDLLDHWDTSPLASLR